MCSSPSSNLITLTEIEAVLRDDLSRARKNESLPPLECNDLRYLKRTGNGHTFYTVDQRRKLLVSKCKELKESVQDPDGHYSRIDRSLSASFKCSFVLGESETIPIVAEKAYRILTRLPPRPLSLLDFPTNLSLAYFTAPPPVDRENRRCALSWENLQVASFLGKNLIRIALTHVLELNSPFQTFRDSINFIAEMLAMCSALESQAANENDYQSWFVVRSFLWSFWQRALMIYLYSKMTIHLRSGFGHGNDPGFYLEDPFPSPGWSAQQMSCRVSSQGKAKYMCSWAFELLRTEPVCMGMDFRLFHQRYSQLHGHLGARCSPDSTEPCDGTHSDNCYRFRGMKIVDQSAHDAQCRGDCPKLPWDESSYRKVSGARAVSLAETDDQEDLLRYCKASEKTIAISHVWCHGQGGRPEDGFNKCLHQRYKRIAEGMGCDSYWMDTPCIPQDHELRDEAIREINGVFATCHLTLVCDKDLMQIDATDLNLELMEAIIATILVCDWNVRAWTFLEAMKGRKNIHFLCKNDITLSYPTILRAVFDQGRIDLVNLCLLVPHMLPWASAHLPESYWSKTSKYAPEISATENSNSKLGKIPLATVGTMLSFRPASRKGDDVVIWSLILNDELFYTAEAFWGSRVGTQIKTGFLVSSAPRLRARGLSWAPITSYAAPSLQGSRNNTVYYRPFEGADTEWASIEKEGLIADWAVYEFPGQLMKTNLSIYKSKLLGHPANEIDELDKIRRQFLKHYRFGVLLQPIWGSSGNPRSDGNPFPMYRGRIAGTLLVVCGCNKAEIKSVWKEQLTRHKWRGVYEWPKEVPLPAFEQMTVLIT
jgi:hypothetical protein